MVVSHAELKVAAHRAGCASLEVLATPESKCTVEDTSQVVLSFVPTRFMFVLVKTMQLSVHLTRP